jgi:hypothetical protein
MKVLFQTNDVNHMSMTGSLIVWRWYKVRRENEMISLI